VGIEEEFGRAARILRKRRDLTLQDMADRGFDKSYLCEVEKGMHNPGLRYISRLAEGLEVEVVDLFWGLGATPRELMGRIGVALDRLILEIAEGGQVGLAKEAVQLLREREERLLRFLEGSERKSEGKDGERARLVTEKDK
jgi:transcriptional regulator with XRE-family HTH domain